MTSNKAVLRCPSGIESKRTRICSAVAACFQDRCATKRTKAIESIEIGDKVWAWDHLGGAASPRSVVRVFRRWDQLVLEIKYQAEGSQASLSIYTTREHPFWVEGGGWAPAKDLSAGDVLHGLPGSIGQTRVIAVQPHGRADVFNIEVEGLHNYFVGDVPVLVHNRSEITLTDPYVTLRRGRQLVNQQLGMPTSHSSGLPMYRLAQLGRLLGEGGIKVAQKALGRDGRPVSVGWTKPKAFPYLDEPDNINITRTLRHGPDGPEKVSIGEVAAVAEHMAMTDAAGVGATIYPYHGMVLVEGPFERFSPILGERLEQNPKGGFVLGTSYDLYDINSKQLYAMTASKTVGSMTIRPRPDAPIVPWTAEMLDILHAGRDLMAKHAFDDIQWVINIQRRSIGIADLNGFQRDIPQMEYEIKNWGRVNHSALPTEFLIEQAEHALRKSGRP